MSDDPRERVTLIPSEMPPSVPDDPGAVAVLLRKVLDEQAAARSRDEAILAALQTLAAEVAALHEDQRRLPCRRPTELPPCPHHPTNGGDARQ